MNKPNLESVEREIEKKCENREKRKKPRMKVDGNNVRKLSRFIGNK